MLINKLLLNLIFSTSSSLPLILVFASQMLMDFISGRLGGVNDIKLASKIVRVIVAGNSVVANDVTKGKDRLVGDLFHHVCLTTFIIAFYILREEHCKN